MDSWQRLDDRLVGSLTHVWQDCLDVVEKDEQKTFLEQVLKLKATSNGVANCIEHFIGSMVKQVVKRNPEVNLQATLEKIEGVEKHKYLEYIGMLEKCQCAKCLDVLQFDRIYKRYLQGL